MKALNSTSIKIFLSFLTGIFILAAIPATGQPNVELTSNKDSYMKHGASNTNEGANKTMRIQASGDNRNLVAFDMTSVSLVGLVSATLVLTIEDNADNWGGGFPGTRYVDVHRVLESWTEGNAWHDGANINGSGAGVTWNCPNDPNITNGNTDGAPQWNGGNYAPATAPGILHFNGLSGTVTWDVLADVLAGANDGWLVRKRNEGQSGKVWYHTREADDAANHPKLILVYDCAQALDLTSIIDSYLRGGAKNKNEGANTNLRVKGSKNRTVVGFDMTNVSTSGLESATLVMTISNDPANWGGDYPGTRYVDVHRILEPWSEGNGFYQPNTSPGTGMGVTWNCPNDADISDGGIDGSTWGGGNYAVATAPGVLHFNHMTGEVWWDVTADLISGADYGWLIKKRNEGQGGRVYYWSNESAEAETWPRLELRYCEENNARLGDFSGEQDQESRHTVVLDGGSQDGEDEDDEDMEARLQFSDATGSMKAFPNPFESEFELVIKTDISESTNLIICDMMGKVVYQQSIELTSGINTIDVVTDENLAAGIYFVSTIVNGQVQTLRMVKN